MQSKDGAGTWELKKVQAADSGKQMTKGLTDTGCANGGSNDCEEQLFLTQGVAQWVIRLPQSSLL